MNKQYEVNYQVLQTRNTLAGLRSVVIFQGFRSITANSEGKVLFEPREDLAEAFEKFLATGKNNKASGFSFHIVE